jgi:hypothetical protein
VADSPDAGIRRVVEFVATGTDDLLVSYTLPLGGARAAVVIVPGLFNDVVRNLRRELLLARALAGAGFAAARFDYSGTANSGRTGRPVTLGSMCADGEQVIRHVRDATGVDVAGFLGTRAGALVAASLAASDARAALALWDPVVDGDTYLADALRSRLMSDMRRESGRRTTAEALRSAIEHGSHVDLNGYALDHALYGSLTGASLRAADGGARAVFLAQFRRRPKLRYEYEMLTNEWRRLGWDVSTFCFEHDEQWWFNEDITVVEDFDVTAAPLITATAKWFADVLAEGPSR